MGYARSPPLGKAHLAIPETEGSLFIQLTRRTIYFKETNILNILRRFRMDEAKSRTRIDGFIRYRVVSDIQ